MILAWLWAAYAEDAVTDTAAEPAPVEIAPEPAPPKWPGMPEPGSKHYDLEEMYAAKRYEEGLKEARARLKANPGDADLCWITTRFLFEVGELFGESVTTAQREAHYEEMIAVANQGLAIKPGDPHLRFARGIGSGRLGTTRGVLSSLWMASSVEQDWLATANSGFRYASLDGNEILPCDVYQALGIYYRLVPDAWIVKVIAGTRGSLEKSLSYHQQADKCVADRHAVIKELGVTELCIGTKNDDAAMIEQGKATLRRVLPIPPESEKSKIDIRHAQMLIDDPSLACGYSRDSQQDTDASKLEN